MPEKPFWSKSKTGTLVVWDRKNQTGPKCPYRRLGCIGRLYLADKKNHPNQTFCDYCGAVWVNPLKLSLEELSDYKLSSSDENWFYRLLATRKLVLPISKPGFFRRQYLRILWHL